MRWTIGLVLLMAAVSTFAAEPAVLTLDDSTREHCLSILRKGANSEEFWPSMHAAEGLTQAGFPGEARKALSPRLPVEVDDQHRCGLARELVRAGDVAHAQIMLDILAGENRYGHTHACESLYKIWQIGDGRHLRKAMIEAPEAKTRLMAAAALTRWGNRDALSLIRNFVADPDGDTARIAAWILARVGDASDLPALREGSKRFTEPLTKAYFDHALACLGDADGMKTLIMNLKHSDPAVRTYACEFAPDALAIAAKENLLALLDDSVLDIRIRAAQALLVLSKPPVPDRHETIVRNVFVASEKNPRYSEGSVIALRDGRLLYAMTENRGAGPEISYARILATESSDEGRTWKPPRVLLDKIGEQNVMMRALQRLSYPARFDAHLGCFYCTQSTKKEDATAWLRVSSDECKTLGPPVQITIDPEYSVMDNGITILPDGRLIVAVMSQQDVAKVGFKCSTWFSDDSGRSWKRSHNTLSYEKLGAWAPNVIPLHNGNVRMYFSTEGGQIRISESTDRGETWTASRLWKHPRAEAFGTVREIPSTGDWVLVLYDSPAGLNGERDPMSFAVSCDEGHTWLEPRPFEAESTRAFCDFNVTFNAGRMLMTYGIREENTGRISSRFRSMPISDLYSP